MSACIQTSARTLGYAGGESILLLFGMPLHELFRGDCIKEYEAGPLVFARGRALHWGSFVCNVKKAEHSQAG